MTEKRDCGGPWSTQQSVAPPACYPARSPPCDAIDAYQRTTLRLETGVLQHEATTPYERAGFIRCGPCGDDIDDPHGVFMVKLLG